MPADQSPKENSVADFVNLSETESLCRYCFTTVRAELPSLLTLAEEVHSISCLYRDLDRVVTLNL
jgi:hypothetical protein